MRGLPSRIRRRFSTREAAKHEAELRWWLEHWDPVLREGALWDKESLALCGDAAVASTYEGRRWQQARAAVARVMEEADLEPGFFADKVVVDLGPGPLGFPDACPAAVCIGIEPLAQRFADHGLLMDSRAVYLAVGGERIPLVSGTIDVVVSRNNLDHVERPARVISEVARILRPGGAFVLNVDIDHSPSPTEPHRLTLEDLRGWLTDFSIVSTRTIERSHGGGGRAVVFVATRRTPRDATGRR